MSASECMLSWSYCVLVVILVLDIVGVHLLSRQIYEGPAALTLVGSSMDPTQAHSAKPATAAGRQKGKRGALEADVPPLVVSASELWPGLLGRG